MAAYQHVSPELARMLDEQCEIVAARYSAEHPDSPHAAAAGRAAFFEEVALVFSNTAKEIRPGESREDLARAVDGVRDYATDVAADLTGIARQAPSRLWHDEAPAEPARRGSDVSRSHPDVMDRPLGEYDPSEPLVVRYGDVIASRNAAATVMRLMQSKVDPISDFHRWSIRTSIAMAALPDDVKQEFETDAAAIEWLSDLRDRLTHCLPDMTAPPPRF